MTRSSSGVFSCGFPTRILYACPDYFILLYLITLIVFGEDYKLIKIVSKYLPDYTASQSIKLNSWPRHENVKFIHFIATKAIRLQMECY
jgi:hypothetical protein